MELLRTPDTAFANVPDWSFEPSYTNVTADDGTVIEITNPGVRTASPEVTQQLARGEKVDPSLYYFRTSPTFKAAGEANAWLQRTVFVGRGIRNPDSVVIDYYEVR